MARQKLRTDTVSLESKPPPAVDLDRILDAAAFQFAAQGFDGVSMRDLSRQSACPMPSIYYHFNSKSDLYEQAHEHKFDQTIDFINERLAGLRDQTRRFEVLIEAFFDLFNGDRSLLLLMQRDVIDAAVTPQRFLSKRQYEYFMSLICRVASEVKGAPVSRETAFTVGALIFGYCELLCAVNGVDPARAQAGREAEKARLVRAAANLLRLD